MKLVLLNQANKEFFRNVVNLGDKEVATVNGYMLIEPDEKRMIIDYAQKVYSRVIRKSGCKNFLGHIRIDLVPEITNFEKTGYGYRWDLGLKGVYEINSNSPECGAATSALHTNFPELAQRQPNPAERIIESLNGHIGERKIAFVIGKGAVKKEWGHVFMRSLQNRGLDIEEVDPEKADQYQCVWRFGDIRSGSYSEFSSNFRDMLLEKQKDDLVLNTVPESPMKDIGNKKFLLDKGERELRSKEDGYWALRQSDMVLKPFRGTSGKGIYFQRDFSENEWERKIFNCINKGYGLFKSKWLPRLDIDRTESGIVMDLSPSFLAKGDRLDYLYSISRIERCKIYDRRGTINVAKGGGFVGTLLD